MLKKHLPNKIMKRAEIFFIESSTCVLIICSNPMDPTQWINLIVVHANVSYK